MGHPAPTRDHSAPSYGVSDPTWPCLIPSFGVTDDLGQVSHSIDEHERTTQAPLECSHSFIPRTRSTQTFTTTELPAYTRQSLNHYPAAPPSSRGLSGRRGICGGGRRTPPPPSNTRMTAQMRQHKRQRAARRTTRRPHKEPLTTYRHGRVTGATTMTSQREAIRRGGAPPEAPRGARNAVRANAGNRYSCRSNYYDLT